MRSRASFYGILALALASGGLWLGFSGAAPQLAPDLAVTTLQGERLQLRELRGRPVLVNFWSISCASCIDEIPRLTALYSELATRGLEIIAINMPYDPPSHVLAVSRGRQIPYPVALDVKGEASRAFGDIRLTPTTFLVSAQGRVIDQQTGPLDLQRLRSLVLRQLHDQHPARNRTSS